MKYWNEKIETMPRKELDKLIEKKLRYTVRYAYEFSPFYHRLFDEIKIKPSDIKNQKDLLRKLPVITKKDIIENQPPKTETFNFFSAPIGKRYTRPYTSGTKGQPKICSRTIDDWEYSREACARAYTAAGIGRGDVVLDCLPFGINVSGLASMYGFFNTVGAEVITAGLSEYPSKTELVRIHKPTVLFGSPSYIDRLSRILELDGLNTKSLNIRKVLVVGEASSDEKRERIGESFNAEVYDIYASDEGDLMAYEDGCNEGLHVNEDLIYLTAIDSIEDREPVTEGEVGLDLLTTFVDPGKYKGFVVINYHHGDKFAITEMESKCPCGRTTKRISHPTRADDVIEFGQAKISLADIEPIIYNKDFSKYLTGEYELIKDFDVHERLHKLTLRVDVKGKVKDAPLYLKDRIKEEILKRNLAIALMSGTGGVGIFEVEIVDEGGLEVYKQVGKSKRIIYKHP